jgi:hypothetical protein
LAAEDPAAGNAELQFANGKLVATMTKAVNISTKNKVTNVPATDKSYKATIAAPTGAVSGFFTNPADSSKPKFSAIVLQKGQNQAAFGYFLSTVAKNGPTGESGGVTLRAK